MELRATGEAVRRLGERSFRRVDEVYDPRFRLPSGELVTIRGTAEHTSYVPAHGAYIDLEPLEEGVEVGLAGPRPATHPRLNGTPLHPVPPRTGGFGAVDSRSA